MDVNHQLFQILVAGFNVLLHSTGCYLLWKTYKWSQVTTQQLIILNLSVSEGLINLQLLVMRAFSLSGWSVSDIVYSSFVQPVQFSLLYVIFFIMLFMTLDRLMSVLLSLKYQVYWTVGRTKKVLVAIWILGFIVSVCICLLQEFSIRFFIRVKCVYLLMAFSIVFVITAISTYATIFWKYRRSRHSLGTDPSNAYVQHQSQMRFRIPALIIFTYLVFNAIPLIIWIAHSKNDFWAYMSIKWYTIGYVSDGMIYIFLQPKVRKQFFKCCEKQETADSNTLQNV